MKSQYCPSCGERICPPSGPSKDILVVGEFPTRLDMDEGTLFCSPSHSIPPMEKFMSEKNWRSVLHLSGIFVYVPCGYIILLKAKNVIRQEWIMFSVEAKGKKAILLVRALYCLSLYQLQGVRCQWIAR